MQTTTLQQVQQQLKEYEDASNRASQHESLDLALGATLAAMQHLAWAIAAIARDAEQAEADANNAWTRRLGPGVDFDDSLESTDPYTGQVIGETVSP